MLDLKMTCGGVIESVKVDGVERMLTKPPHNRVVNTGIDYLLCGFFPDYSLIPSDSFLGGSLPTSPDTSCGCLVESSIGSSSTPTTMDMTGLQGDELGYQYSPTGNAAASGTLTYIDDVNGYVVCRDVQSYTATNPGTIWEFCTFYDARSNKKLFSRCVLNAGISVLSGQTVSVTYTLRIKIPFFTAQKITIPGISKTAWVKCNAIYANGADAANNYCTGYSYYPSSATKFVNFYDTAYPAAILMPFSALNDTSNVSYWPLLSTDTTLALNATYASSVYTKKYAGDMSYTLGSYTAGQGYRDFTWSILPSAGAQTIAYMTIRGLSFRFGDFDSDGTTWVASPISKTADQRLDVKLRYTYAQE